MDSNKVDMFMMANAKLFPTEKVLTIKENLEKMDNDKLVMLQSISFKDPTIALLLAFFIGADRIYLGNVGIGILKIISMFFFVGLIWWLIDLFSIKERTFEHNTFEFNKVGGFASAPNVLKQNEEAQEKKAIVARKTNIIILIIIILIVLFGLYKVYEIRSARAERNEQHTELNFYQTPENTD